MSDIIPPDRQPRITPKMIRADRKAALHYPSMLGGPMIDEYEPENLTALVRDVYVAMEAAREANSKIPRPLVEALGVQEADKLDRQLPNLPAIITQPARGDVFPFAPQ